MPRQAQSAYLQILNGNPNNRTKKELSKRTKNEKRMAFSNENMNPPTWLSGGAKKEFNRIVNLFDESKLLNEADITELAMYCDLLAEYKACNTRLKKNGRSQDGKPSQDLRMKLQLSQQIDKLAKNLGLTPAARASMAINLDENDEDDEDDF
nr:phage terminase small subunit P27 family [uncultured Ligilactobacillus sp.]